MICKCGAEVSVSELTKKRWRYKCTSCGRYEITLPPALQKKEKYLPPKEQKQ